MEKLLARRTSISPFRCLDYVCHSCAATNVRTYRASISSAKDKADDKAVMNKERTEKIRPVVHKSQESKPSKEKKTPTRKPTTTPSEPHRNSAHHQLSHPTSSRNLQDDDLVPLNAHTLHLYETQRPPTPTELTFSNKFFARNTPTHIWTAAYMSQVPADSPHPEVAFVGRSNTGKSTLLNALFGRTREKIARTSKKPGRTKTMNAFGCGPENEVLAAQAAGGQKARESWRALGRGAVVVVDMPGYGKGSQMEWGVEIMKILETRKQLRRTFVLIDPSHGAKDTDIALLNHLSSSGIPHTILLSKTDRLLCPHSTLPSPQTLSKGLFKLAARIQSIRQKCQDTAQANTGKKPPERALDVLGVSSQMDIAMGSGGFGGSVKAGRGRLGVDALRWAVLSSCGVEVGADGKVKKMGAYERLVVDGGEDLDGKNGEVLGG